MNSELKYDGGFAFILEGDTEKEFYLALLEYLSKKHGCNLQRMMNDKTMDIEYQLHCESSTKLIKFHVVNCISQMSRAGAWFASQCYDNHSKLPWQVFLCYDTDSYMENISKFYEDDWQELRRQLKKARVLDIAAAADIEDVMLTDLPGICRYLDCDIPDSIPGRKGKVKMKNLFRDHGMAYHEGKRARMIIDLLDMQTIIDHSSLPLSKLEKLVFSKRND